MAAPISIVGNATPSTVSAWDLSAAGQGFKNNVIGKNDEAHKIQEAARGFETILVRRMLSEMRNPIFSADKKDVNSGYLEMMDDQLAAQITKGKGIGFAEAMTRQLMKQSDIAKLIDTQKKAV